MARDFEALFQAVQTAANGVTVARFALHGAVTAYCDAYQKDTDATCARCGVCAAVGISSEDMR